MTIEGRVSGAMPSRVVGSGSLSSVHLIEGGFEVL